MLKQLAMMLSMVLASGGQVIAAAECSRSVGSASEQALYRFVASDSRWVVFPFGWHATAQLSCEYCNGEGEIGAYAWLSVGEAKGIGAASDEDADFMAAISSMWFSGYQGEAPVADGEKEPIRWHEFSGYARRFVGAGSDGEKHILIGARLTDGCAHVRLYTAVGQVQSSTALAYLQPMLEGVRVERRK